MKEVNLASIFEVEPYHWGLRGDPCLWREIKTNIQFSKNVKTTNDFEKLLNELFLKLTNSTPESATSIFVERFSFGGMSSGHVSPEFWLKTAFPMLVDRFNELIGDLKEGSETMIDNFTIDQIRDEIIKFKNDADFQKLENFYYSKSFSEILGVSRREISHSGFLAWLLGNMESHNLGEFPIKKFLDIILKFSDDKLKRKHSDLFNSFVTEDYLIQRLFVKPEFSIKNVGRIDIYIELTILIVRQTKNIKIVIENKVESRENNDQTNNYFNHFNPSEDGDNVILYIYLTSLSTLELIELTEPESNCKEFIQINYQSIVDYLIEPALNQNISTRTQNILTEYLKSLSQPSIDEEADGHKQELIMALGNEERKLLSSFWEKNQKLILAALYAISSDPAQEKDTRDSIRDALDSLSSDKDRSTYNIKFNGVIFSRNFKKSDIGLQTIKLLQANNLIDPSIIYYLKEDKSCSFLLLKKKEDVTETEIKYRKYKTNGLPELIYNGEEFYVARNWGIGNIQKFISKFIDKFPGLEYETNS